MPGTSPAFSSAPITPQQISTGGGAAVPPTNVGANSLTSGIKSVTDALAKARKQQQGPYGQGLGRPSYMTPPSSASATMQGQGYGGGNILDRASASPYAGLSQPVAQTPTGPPSGGGGPAGPPSTAVPPGAGAGTGAGAAILPPPSLPRPAPLPAQSAPVPTPPPRPPGLGMPPNMQPGAGGQQAWGWAQPGAPQGQVPGSPPQPMQQSPVNAARYGPLPSPAPLGTTFAPAQQGPPMPPMQPSANPMLNPLNMFGAIS